VLRAHSRLGRGFASSIGPLRRLRPRCHRPTQPGTQRRHRRSGPRRGDASHGSRCTQRLCWLRSRPTAKRHSGPRPCHRGRSSRGHLLRRVRAASVGVFSSHAKRRLFAACSCSIDEIIYAPISQLWRQASGRECGYLKYSLLSFWCTAGGLGPARPRACACQSFAGIPRCWWR
jgi:hypothetical protein